MEQVYRLVSEIRHTVERVQDLSLLSTGITSKLFDLINQLVEELEKIEKH